MPTSRFNPELSAELHNKILEYGWIGSGREPTSLPSTTWWEQFSPISFDLASRLKPSLIRFLRLAKVGIYDDQKFHFFFHARGLFHKNWLFLSDDWMRDSPRDRYISLYYGSGSKSDQEVGIVFDQETELASFIPQWEDLRLCIEEDWPWIPLQDILQAYLDMIKDKKVTTYSDIDSGSTGGTLCQSFPWEIHQHTSIDVERAISAFTRLLDAIESRLPQKSQPHSQSSQFDEASNRNFEEQSSQQLCFPYTDSVLDSSFVQDNSFARVFLSTLPARQINFRYIAPGIRIQSPTEFMNQPFADRRDNYKRWHYRSEDDPISIPLLLFRGKGENKSPWVRPWFLDGIVEDIPSGLYIESLEDWRAENSGNETRLLLPFEIGMNKFARSTEGFLIGKWGSSHATDGLYRVVFASGFMPLDSFSSHIHRVLLNWAERVENGDWEVNDDGVADGIEKFKEADTQEHWKKYHIPWQRDD